MTLTKQLRTLNCFQFHRQSTMKLPLVASSSYTMLCLYCVPAWFYSTEGAHDVQLSSRWYTEDAHVGAMGAWDGVGKCQYQNIPANTPNIQKHPEISRNIQNLGMPWMPRLWKIGWFFACLWTRWTCSRSRTNRILFESVQCSRHFVGTAIPSGSSETFLSESSEGDLCRFIPYGSALRAKFQIRRDRWVQTVSLSMQVLGRQ